LAAAGWAPVAAPEFDAVCANATPGTIRQVAIAKAEAERASADESRKPFIFPPFFGAFPEAPILWTSSVFLLGYLRITIDIDVNKRCVSANRLML